MTEQQDIKDPWEELKVEHPAKTSPEERERWWRLRRQMIDAAKQYGWKKGEAARRADIAASTFYGWMDGSYNTPFDTLNDKVERFFQAQDDLNQTSALVPTAPGFVTTPTAQKFINALIFAQTMPEITVIIAGAGVGKTHTLDYYQNMRPNVFKITMRPSTRTPFKMMNELADLFNLSDVDRTATRLDKAVGTRVKRNGRSPLILVDEAQHLQDEAVNQLRYFYDVYGAGLALVGNEELYTRYGRDADKPAYAQLKTRFGLWIRQADATQEDMLAIIDAWGVKDEEMRKLCLALAHKPGALRTLTKTLQYAGMVAAGERRAMTAKDIRIAAQQRGLGN